MKDKVIKYSFIPNVLILFLKLKYVLHNLNRNLWKKIKVRSKYNSIKSIVRRPYKSFFKKEKLPELIKEQKPCNKIIEIKLSTSVNSSKYEWLKDLCIFF